MRIGLVIYGSINTLSGGYLYDRELVKCLETFGDQVEIISIRWRNYPRHLGDNFSLGLLDYIKSRSLDLLIQDELNHPSFFLLNYWLRRQLHFPFISLVHHLRCSENHHYLKNQFYRIVERLYLLSVDGFIYNSETTKSAVSKIDKRLEQRPYVVATPGGDRLRPGEMEYRPIDNIEAPEEFSILFVGNITPRKGLDVLLDALLDLPQNGWTLNVVGDLRIDIRYVTDLERLVIKRGWQNKVRFWGAIPDDEVIRLMKQSHVLVVPSFYEGFGIVYLEGMGFGLPCIGTTKGGAKEIIVDGENGYLISPGDYETLAQRLLVLLDNPVLVDKMSRCAKKTYSNFPSWKTSMIKIRDFLHDFENYQ